MPSKKRTKKKTLSKASSAPPPDGLSSDEDNDGLVDPLGSSDDDSFEFTPTFPKGFTKKSSIRATSPPTTRPDIAEGDAVDKISSTVLSTGNIADIPSLPTFAKDGAVESIEDSLDGIPMKSKTAFANDPVRSPLLSVSLTDINTLNGRQFITTSLLDYIIQRGMPRNLPDDILIGTSNSNFWTCMNAKDLGSNHKADTKSSYNLRRKYQLFNNQRYQFLCVNCTKSHFFVIYIVFDPKLPDFFETVSVYDSLRRSSRSSEAPSRVSVPAEFLRTVPTVPSEILFFQHQMEEAPFARAQSYSGQSFLQELS
jgi:hypothetical protein